MTLVLAGIGLAAVCAVIIYFWLRKSPGPEELERRRREMIDQVGKMGDGMIIDVQSLLVSYTYHVRGIEYQATQDVSAIDPILLPTQWGTIEAVGIKYDPRNPANSLIVSEKWSGLPKKVNQ
jgi:hypothetical protein